MGKQLMRILAYVMPVVALCAMVAAFWQSNYVDELRENYMRRHGSIDIPEAMYFDGKAAFVIAPALLAFLVCQVLAVVFFVLSWRPWSWLFALSLWALWAAAWGLLVLYCYHRPSATPQQFPATGCYDFSPFAGADRVQVFALDFNSGSEGRLHDPDTEGRFHGYRVLGQTDVGPGPERRRLLDALQDGINRPGSPAACFFPRHGLRVIMGKAKTDYLICFHCSYVYIFDQGRYEYQQELVSTAPENVFNAVLTSHGVPVPP